MKRILCYGDSNTWGHNPTGIDPVTGAIGRYSEGVRWTGVMQRELGEEYFVCEEGLCGRTTVFEDPTHYGWNGYMHFWKKDQGRAYRYMIIKMDFSMEC